MPRNRARLGALTLILVTAALVALALAPAALAAKTVVNEIGEGTTGGLFDAPKGIAVNKTGAGGVPSGTFYVIDGNNRRLQRFSPSGDFVSAWGWGVATGASEYQVCTEAASCEADTGGFEAGRLSVPIGIAVDQGTGTVYVSDSSGSGSTAQRRINAYSATGAFEGAFGWEVNATAPAAEFQFCTTATGCKQGSAGGNGGQLSSSPGGLVVDSAGNLYFANGFAKRIDVFTPTFTVGILTNMAFARSFGADVVSTGGTDDGSDIERVAVAASSGTFTLSFGATGTTTTAPIPYNASAADVQSGLEALDAIAPGDIAVGGPAGGPWSVRFTGTLSNSNQAGNLTANAGGLNGGSATVTQLIAGASTNYEVCEAGTTDICKLGATSTGLGGFGIFSPADVAIDSSDHLYVLDKPAKRIEKFDLSVPANPSPVPAPDFDASAALVTAFGATPGTMFALGYDTATDHVYLAGANSTTSPANQIRIEEISSSGAHVATHGTDLTITAANGLAVAPESLGGNIYLASVATDTVFVLNTPPTAALNDVTTYTGTTADLSGSVDPTGGSVSCKFQHSLDGSAWTDVPGDPCASLNPTGGAQPVSGEATGLDEGTLYHVRLMATKPFGAGSATAERTFTTLGRPLIEETNASGVSATAATLNAKVNPQLQATTYHFEYVDDATFEESGFTEALHSPEPEASAGNSGDAVPVSQPIAGLLPEVTYHFRLLATNGTGTREGDEETFTTFSATPDFSGGCPGNEAMRTGPSAKLPDCRAYEQVSPRAKNGGDIVGDPNEVQASPTGNAITFEVSGGIPGGEGAQQVPTYVANRGAEAWSNIGVLPPVSYGSTSLPSGWTSDLSLFFSTTSKKAGEPAFLSRSGTTGAITEISPYTPQGGGRLASASADGSRVFFENEGAQLAPGAAAKKQNLYVWDRDTGQVSLAGVLPDSACASPPCYPPAGSFAGAYAWSSGTGATTLAHGGTMLTGSSGASSYTQEQHVVSPSGDSVYFTAGATGQIYLRKGLDGPTPTTVHVNESERSTPDPAGQQTAAFMMASTDGSKALFTSPQKLTDDASTGPDHPGPTIARANIDGSAKNLNFLGVPGDAGVAVDPTHIYWADPDNGTIGRADLDGSNPNPSFIEVPEIEINPGVLVPPRPQYVAVDSTHLYWTNAANGEDGKGTIGRADLGGGNANATCIKGASNPQGIAVGLGADAGHLYWSNGSPFNPSKRVGRADISGDCAAANASANQAFIEPSVFGSSPRGLAVDEDHIYYLTSSGPSDASLLARVDLDGTSNSTILVLGKSSDIDPQGVAISHQAGNEYVYWAQRKTNTVGRIPIANFPAAGEGCVLIPSCEASFVTGAGSPRGLAVDSAHLYWSANGEAKPNPGTDLYLYDDSAPAGEKLTDLTPDANEAIDVCPGGPEPCGAQVQGVLGASNDASRVYFAANGVLADNEGAHGEHASLGDCKGTVEVNTNAVTGECNLYLWDGGASGEITFIARLAGKDDVANWIPFGPSTTARQRTARVSADGETLLFRSADQLTDYDNEGIPEFYLYRVGEPGVLCLSCNPIGVPPTGRPTLQSVSAFQLHTSSGTSFLTRNLSADGNRVFFETPDKLLAADTNGDNGCPAVLLGGGSYPSCLDVYEWEANGTGSCHSTSQNGGCLYLLSPGTGGASFFADADQTGDNAFIFSRAQLVPGDGDQLQDVYDARVGGGLAGQQQTAGAVQEGCVGEGCRGGGSNPPAALSAGSQSFQGPGNEAVKQAKKHRHHKKKHHKKKHHKKKKHHSKAKANRRAHR